MTIKRFFCISLPYIISLIFISAIDRSANIDLFGILVRTIISGTVLLLFFAFLYSIWLDNKKIGSDMKLSDWITDYAHLIKGATLMFLYRKPPSHYLNYILEGKVPVIILPGIFGTWSFLKPLGDKISLEGHPVYIVPKLGINISDIPSSAKRVRELIDEENFKNVVIIAHSKGGLIAKYMLAYDNKDNCIKGLVSIATPFSGSAMAELLPFSPLRELTHNSDVVKRLIGQVSVNKRIISISPSADNAVWSKEGSFLEGALDNITVSAKGHHKIIYEKRIVDEVINSIDRLSKIEMD